MFGHRFFGARHFGPRYWGDGGSGAPVLPQPGYIVSTTELVGGSATSGTSAVGSVTFDLDPPVE